MIPNAARLPSRQCVGQSGPAHWPVSQREPEHRGRVCGVDFPTPASSARPGGNLLRRPAHGQDPGGQRRLQQVASAEHPDHAEGAGGLAGPGVHTLSMRRGAASSSPP